MPRPRKELSGEPKKRSRTGCWPCKARKVKCGEEKPHCTNCRKTGEICDYSIRLNWGGRARREKEDDTGLNGTAAFAAAPPTASRPKRGSSGMEHVFFARRFDAPVPRHSTSKSLEIPTPEPTPGNDGATLDPRLRFDQQAQQQGVSPSTVTSLPTSSGQPDSPFRWSTQHQTKRRKTDSGKSPLPAPTAPMFAPSQQPDPTSTAGHFPHSINSIVNGPATPGSSINSGSPYTAGQSAPLGVHEQPDLRRLSVKSLLSEPPEDSESHRRVLGESTGHRVFGYDHGLPDLDIPHNDDLNVLLPKSSDLRRKSAAVSVASSSSGDADPKHIAFEPGGYYSQPVPVRIPRFLEPLPEELANSQMNLLYFHHFINHTGRIMVPHDCPENPFRDILPQMAVGNQQLLHLMLAFSASHRARLLDHPEPSNRIAGWMADVLPALREALNEPSSPGVAAPTDPCSLAPLATAIMLASLEIISPHTFDVSIPWQHHLQVARRMIILKGGLDHLAQKADGARDKAIFFLSRWFAYLDVIGSLSGSEQEQPLVGAYLEDGGGLWLVNRDNEEIYQIDCFFGFSGRCISLLAQVAELATQCDKQRIDPATSHVRPDWTPSDSTRQQAADLERRLNASASTVYGGCTHAGPASNPSSNNATSKNERDIEEIYATNEAYHWAGLLNLSRRVLGRPPADPEVQDSVRKILGCLQKVRRGSSAESCLLFPMFSAGCEAQSEEDRAIFMERMKAVEGWGMANVARARTLMKLVWDSGRGWETLVAGEFFG